MKKAVIGILAHVDAGKTTLSEALLYQTGAIRKEGSVDAGDTVMDYNAVEADRGITVFSSQADIQTDHMQLSLLDTPGHVDFSGEMERTLSVLDYAVLVISGPAGIQSHTRTLWDLLEKYHLPTVIFVNKMDIANGRTHAEILQEIRSELSDSAAEFPEAVFQDPETGKHTEAAGKWAEDVATADEKLLDTYMESGEIDENFLEQAVAERRLFPVVFGAARENQGVDTLIHVLERAIRTPDYPEDFGARVYKVDRDDKGARLTFMKITGGRLLPRTEIRPGPSGGPGDAAGEGDENADRAPVKVTELRHYQGNRYETVKEADAGDLITIPGLTGSLPGMGYGFESDRREMNLTPVFRYRAVPQGNVSSHTLLLALREIEEGDPLLHVEWFQAKDEIHLRLMGPIQKEILTRELKDRYQIGVTFDQGEIRYMETIQEPVEGHGHFEPLRHFADVRLRLEPLAPGEGIAVESQCPTDELEINYQHQIMRTLQSGRLTGILTNAGLTDIRFILIGGKSSTKHTEGGDFRKATELAVRDALIHGTSVLLEPYYRIHLTVPNEKMGRALNDLNQMYGKIQTPVQDEKNCLIEGSVPVSELGDYQAAVNSYTGGLGHLAMEPGGYLPCHNNAEEIIEETGYDYTKDEAHPYQNIYVHREYLTEQEQAERDALRDASGNVNRDDPIAPRYVTGAAGQVTAKKKKKDSGYEGYTGLTPELQQIFESTYGKIERKDLGQAREMEFDGAGMETPEEAKQSYLRQHPAEKERRDRKRLNAAHKKQYVLVDCYNVIFSTPALHDLAKTNFDSARGRLLDLLSNYQGHLGCELIAIFDAYKVKGNPGSITRWNNIYVVYTREAQTADAYIERTTHEIAHREDADITVVTSDGLEQMIVAGEGARRISSREFEGELARVNGEGLERFHRKNQE